MYQVLSKRSKGSISFCHQFLPLCDVPSDGEHPGFEQHLTTGVLMITAVTAVWGERLDRMATSTTSESGDTSGREIQQEQQPKVALNWRDPGVGEEHASTWVLLLHGGKSNPAVLICCSMAVDTEFTVLNF